MRIKTRQFMGSNSGIIVARGRLVRSYIWTKPIETHTVTLVLQKCIASEVTVSPNRHWHCGKSGQTVQKSCAIEFKFKSSTVQAKTVVLANAIAAYPHNAHRSLEVLV